MTRADTCANCGRAPVAVDVIEASTGERSAVCMTCYLAAYSDVTLAWQTSTAAAVANVSHGRIAATINGRN